MEEFERAVCQSYKNIGDDITVTRHRQFVSAIEDQISRVETALKESLNMEGKKPFRWVNLDEEECDDLAHFLSGTSETSQMIKDEVTDLGSTVTSSRSKSNRKEDCNFGSEISKMQMSNPGESSEEILTSVEDSSPDRNVLEIVIDSDNRHTNASTEATPKKKGSKPFSWGARGADGPTAKESKNHSQMKMINWVNHVSLILIHDYLWKDERSIVFNRIYKRFMARCICCFVLICLVWLYIAYYFIWVVFTTMLMEDSLLYTNYKEMLHYFFKYNKITIVLGMQMEPC